jgi:hypothetical protein
MESFLMLLIFSTKVSKVIALMSFEVFVFVPQCEIECVQKVEFKELLISITSFSLSILA